MNQKIMKRILAFVLSFAMVLGGMSFGAVRAAGTSIKVDAQSEYTQGQAVSIPVVLEGNTNTIAGLQVRIKYSTDAFPNLDVVADEGDLLYQDRGIQDVNKQDAGQVGVAYVDVETAITGDGTLFHLKDTLPASYTGSGVQIEVEVVDVLDPDNGKITVTGVPATFDVVSQGTEYTYVLTGSNVTAKQGEKATVDFTMSDNTLEGVWGVAMNVTYDASVLTVTEQDVEKGELVSGDMTDVHVEENGSIGVMSVEAGTLFSGNGKVMSLNFTVKDDAALGKSDVGISVTELLGEGAKPIEAAGQCVAGSVTVEAKTAAASYKLSGSDVEAEQGEKATVDFTMSENTLQGVKGAVLEVGYDASVLTVEENEVTVGELLSNGTSDISVEESGKVGVMTVSTDDILSGDGKVLSAAFTVKDDAEIGKSDVSIQVVKLIDQSTAPIVATGEITPGSVTVKAKKVAPYTLEGSNETAAQGEKATVTFTMSGCTVQGVKGADIDVTYDASVLTIQESDVVAGELVNGSAFDANVEESGKIGVMTVSTDDMLFGDGTVFSAAFTVKPDAQLGKSEVGIHITKLIDAQAHPVVVEDGVEKAGSVTVTQGVVVNPDQEAADAWKAENADILGKTVDNVAVTDEAAVDSALAGYDELTPGAQGLVTEEKALLDSLKAKINELKAGAEVKAEADAWKQQNADILGKTVENVTIEDETAVDAALAGYEQLSPEAQGLVTEEKALLDSLKAKIEELKAGAEVQAEADAWKQQNADILGKTVEDVAITDEAAVDAALAGYGQLSPEAQGLVTDEKALLDSLKAKINELKAGAEVKAEADAWKQQNADILGKTVENVTIEDETAVDAALAGYEQLSPEAQGLVTEEKALLDSLKAKIEELKAGAEVQAEADAWKQQNADILGKTVGDVAITDEAAVDAALAGYEDLSSEAQGLVSDEKALLDSLKSKIDELKKELADYKQSKKDALDSARKLYDDSTLSPEQIQALDQAVTDAKNAIDQQTTKDGVDVEYNKGLQAMQDAVPEVSLEDAKTNAKAQIDEARAKWNSSSLTETDRERLDALVKSAKDAIDAAQDLPGVADALADGLASINGFSQSERPYIPGGGGSSSTTPGDDKPDDNKPGDDKPYVPEADASARVYRNIATGQKGAISAPAEEGVTVQFVSSQPDVATVSANGQVVALKAGKTNISIYVTKDGVTTKTTIRLTVKDKDKVPTTVRDLGDVKIASDGTPVTILTKNMKVKETSTFKVLLEEGAKVEYSVKNSKIAKVSSKGKITGKKAGTTSVIAKVTLNGTVQEYRVKVTVTKK